MNVFEALILGLLQGFTEYLPVSRTSEMCLRESDEPSVRFETRDSILRRSIRSYAGEAAKG